MKKEMEMVSQELFYQWNVSLKADSDISKVTVEIANVKQGDRVRVLPNTAVISKWEPKWFSGFSEPTRNPDYYVRAITVPDFSSHQGAEISIRRLMLENSPFPDEIMRIEHLVGSRTGAAL